MYDLIIIGGGPAACAAAVYAASPLDNAQVSLKPSGFNISASGKLPFPRPLSLAA